MPEPLSFARQDDALLTRALFPFDRWPPDPRPEAPDPRHQRLVDVAERLRCVVRVLADLVCELRQPLEVALLQFGPQLPDEVLEIVGEALCVFQ